MKQSIKKIGTVAILLSMLLLAGFPLKPGENTKMGTGEIKIEACHRACDLMYEVCMNNIPTDNPLPLAQVCQTLQTACHERCGGKDY
jgi:hypothetical protein